MPKINALLKKEYNISAILQKEVGFFVKLSFMMTDKKEIY